ncbi:Pre-mRNA-splicing factor SPF27 [Apodospora peruviana]|uniref:Pre-mRNA-splicing factor SPF27 n=1 Tax=Apodospora peruviana TaxID=516989 RepID=A0AAE0IJB3_9PEZI|nr:Pre-mRNA-splicing factor SPF27 [Apodospora peruviana]
MPSITTVHESLPYIDPEPTPEAREAANVLITAERALVPDDPHHALLPPSFDDSSSRSHLTPLLLAEFERISKQSQQREGTKLKNLNALDLSRYEAIDLPTIPPDSDPAEQKEILSTALSRAYALHAYLAGRRAHLALLDSYGKNAWLVANWHLESELKAIERELAETRRAIDVVTLQRKGAQEETGPEILGLDEAWRRGVGRVLETEAAAENLRREVLEARRTMG